MALEQNAAMLSLKGSTLSVTTVDSQNVIQCIWHDESMRKLYDEALRLASERRAELAQLKSKVK